MSPTLTRAEPATPPSRSPGTPGTACHRLLWLEWAPSPALDWPGQVAATAASTADRAARALARLLPASDSTVLPASWR